MNSQLGDAYTEELVKLFQQQGSLLYDGQHSLCLTTPCLHFLQKRFSALQESTVPVPVKFAELQCLQGCLAKVASLKLIADKQIVMPTTAMLNLEPFRALHTLILKKVTLSSVTGLQRLRSQLRVLVVQRCQVGNIDDVIVRCCGDDSTSFVWNSLKELDLSNNLIIKLGDSLQYVPCIEKASFSNNSIGFTSPEGTEGRVTMETTGQTSINGALVNGSGGSIVTSSEGITCLEKLTFLHLGFNKLRAVPRFASKAKYTLTVLNLRNNELDGIEGVHELDSLVELDLTYNLLINHSSLSPLKNLHHLALLTLEGNPLSYHLKHRLKTVRNLSNLINKDAFRLEGKKLSTAEKKEISTFLTHYPGSSPMMVPGPSNTPLTRPMPTLEGVQNGVGVASLSERFSKAIQNDTQEEAGDKKPRKKKKGHSVVILESDEGQSYDAPRPNKEELTVGSVPLMHEAHLNKLEQVRKQLENDWIRTINPADSSSTDNSNCHSIAVSSQPTNKPINTQTTPTSKNTTPTNKQATPTRKKATPTSKQTTSPEKSSNKKEKLEGSARSTGKSRERKSRGKRRKHSRGTSVEGVTDVGVGAVSGEECEGEFGPKTSSPERGPTPSNVKGEYFFVERYESDVEDDDSLPTSGRGLSTHRRHGEKEMLIVLTERFIEEQTSRGKRIDRWDVNSLEEVSIDKRPWKKGESEMSDVLFLKFNLDRRDRRRREYVVLEEGNNDMLLGLLNPIVEQNKATLSVENKLECLHCQRVFDKSQALDEPSSETTPLPLGSHKNRSLSKLMCPFCHSQLLQIASFVSKSFKVSQSFSPSPRNKLLSTPPGRAHPTVVTPSNHRKSGFDVTPPFEPSNETSLNSTFNSEQNRDFHANNEDSSIPHSPGHSPVDSIDFDGLYDDESQDLAAGKSPPKEGLVEDLSPWKAQKKSPPLERSLTRPRAGAICEPTGHPAKLQESSENHHQLHEQVRRSSPETVRENGVPTACNPFDQSPDQSVIAPSNNKEPGNQFDQQLDQTSTYDPSKRDKYFDDVVANLPELEASTSVPAESKLHAYMGDRVNSIPPRANPPQSHGHIRSKSVDCHPRRALNTTPPTPRKKYADPCPSGGESHTHSLSSVKEGESLNPNPTSRDSSKKSSLASLDDKGSSSGRPDGEPSSQGYSSGDSGKRSKGQSQANAGGELYEKFFSSGEAKKRVSHDRGYSSGERFSTSRGYTSSEGKKLRYTTEGRVQRVRSHDDIKSSPRRRSGQVGGTGSSSEERKRSSLTLYKEDDPTYIESNLNLYLDMDVFNLDKKEEFRMVFRTPVVQYGHSTEMPALVVVSNLSIYIFRVTAPENSDPTNWLELKANHLLRRLVYIDIGVGYQFMRVEFRAELACYTFLLRDEDKCTLISTKLAFIVSDVRGSSFRTVGVCPFSMENLRYPKRALKEVIMVHYDELSGRTTPTKGRTTPTRGRATPTRGLSSGGGGRPGSSLGRSRDDDDLVLYRLVHKRMSPRSQAPGPTPVTLVVTKTTIFLAKENFTHWPLPRLLELPPRDSLKPPYSDVQQRSITDVEQLVLDTDQPTQVTIRFFKEAVLEGEDRYWSLVMWRASCVNKLVSSIKTLWKESFQLDLPIIHK